MPDEQTTYLSDPYLHQAPVTTAPATAPAPRKRLSPMLAGVVGLAIGAVLGGGGVWLGHSGSSSTPSAPTGQFGNFNGGQGGGPNGTAPSGAPPSGAPAGGGAAG
jgi:hypothetical protein